MVSSKNVFGPVGAVTAVALVMGIRLLSSKKAKATKTNGTRKLIVSSEHSFTEELLSTPITKVYLFTFPNSPHIRNISPFALKLESFLRLHKIPYEVIGTFQFSPKGQMPYIRLNNQQDGPLIADSNFIIQFLTKKLGLLDNSHSLTKEQCATSHAFTRMIEEHTSQIGFYYRYALNMDQFCSAVIPNGWFSKDSRVRGWLMSKLFPVMMPLGFRKKIRYISFGRHSDEEKWTISCQDIQSLSDFLGYKKFMFGDGATALDCTLFGHLAQFLYIPMEFPQKIYMHENCGNIVEYVERFKELFWADWNEV
jgi:glutathione S-transferase